MQHQRFEVKDMVTGVVIERRFADWFEAGRVATFQTRETRHLHRIVIAGSPVPVELVGR